MKVPIALLALFGALPSLAETTPPRPNFLLVCTDDQRWDAMGFVQKEQGDKARFPWLKTPSLDRLRAQGASFRNSFCTTSLCSPGRASLLTGRYAHSHGVTNNHTPLPTDSLTYATALKAAGYSTGYVGKWHMGNQDERPGFDFSASFNGQGKFFGCPVTVRKNGSESKVTVEKWIDDASTDYAIDFLRENKDKPFLLTVGYKSVHGPREPHPDFKDAYAGEKARPVPNLLSPAPFRPEAVLNTKANAPGSPKLLDYFRTLTSVDRSFGRLLDELATLGLDKNTIVIFTSDNGYYLGEHGLGDKRSAYDESLRVPLLVRSPFHSLAGRSLEPFVLNIDIAPTLIDLAGLPVPEDFQGRSLKPLLEDKVPETWRKSFLYEYFYERNFSNNPTILGLRATGGKLVTYPGREKWNEVFDLTADPYEVRNLYQDPAALELRQRLHRELEALKRETGFHVPSHVDPDRFGQETPAKPKRKKAVPADNPAGDT